MLKYFRFPFATTGDKTAVPDAVDSNGNVSYSQGYGFDYQRQKTDPAAKNIERDKMNQIFFDMTTAIAELQSQGVPDFITTALNGGTAYSYAQYAVVKYSGDLYISLVAANTALPSDATKWALLPTPARIQAAFNSSAVATGTADAILGAFTPAIAALPVAPGTLSVFVRAGAANTTTTPTFKADGTAAKTIVKGANQALVAGDIAGAAHWLELQYDATLDKWVLQNPAYGVNVVVSLPEVPVRQTVLGGPVDTAGLPSFLPATSASLSLTSQNIAAGAPFVVASANGFNSTGASDRIGIATANLTWAGLTANVTNYLYVDVAANGALTPGSTTVAPIYQQGGTPAVTANQATFNISQMQMFVGNGAAAPQTYRVFVGEAVAGASTITSTLAYAYMAQNIIQSATLANSTAFSYNHQIGAGIIPRVEYALKVVTANNGYSVGDEIPRWLDGVTSVSDTAVGVAVDSSTARVLVGPSNIAIQTKTTGGVVAVAVTSFKAILRVNRGW